MNCGDCKYSKALQPYLAKGGPSPALIGCHRRSPRVDRAFPTLLENDLCGEWVLHNPVGEFERALAAAP